MTMIAAQMYTVRDFTKIPEDIAQSIQKVKDIGYDAMQVSGFGPIDPNELRKIADDIGIEICATHTGFDRMRDETVTVDRRVYSEQGTDHHREQRRHECEFQRRRQNGTEITDQHAEQVDAHGAPSFRLEPGKFLRADQCEDGS